MAVDLTQTEIDLLEDAATEYGSGVTNLGRDERFFDKTEMTLGITFRVDELDGYQTLLNNHKRYSVVLKDDTLIVSFRSTNGPDLNLRFKEAVTEPGWHDIHVVLDEDEGTLEVLVDGETLYSETSNGLTVGDASYWDVTVGGTPWGRELNGEIADVTILDEAIEIDSEASITERMETLNNIEAGEEVDDSSDNSEDETPVEEDPVDDTDTGDETDSGEETSNTDSGSATSLDDAAAAFGSGVVNLGKDEAFFGMNSMTLGVTFRVDEVDGYQTILNNHKQYSITLVDDRLIVSFNSESGVSLKLYFDEAITEPGWHDIHIVLDGDNDTFQVLVDGDVLYSQTHDDLSVGDASYWKVTAGGTAWGRELNGAIADVSVVDEALAIDPDLSLLERMQYLQAVEAGEIDGEVPDSNNETPTDENPDGGNETPTDENPDNGGNETPTNSEPVFSGDTEGNVYEDGDLTTGGKLTATDADQGESGFEEMSDVGDYGSFSIDESGNWSYTATDSANLQALNSGDVVTETFTVTSIDGTTTEVEVKVNGVDEPVDPDNSGGGNSDTGGSNEDPVFTPKGEIEVSSASELASALSGDVAGYVIKLAPGDYDLDLRNLSFSEDVLIESADPNNPAHFESLGIYNSSNIIINNVEFSSDDAPSGSWGENIINLQNSSGISVFNSTFGNDRAGALNEGFGGISIKNSDDIELSGNEFKNLKNGVGASYSTNLVFENNDFHDIRSDGFTFASVQGVLLEGNSFTDFYHQDGDHSDFIQFWTPGDANEDIIIRDNIMTQGNGYNSQGIFMTSGSEPTKNVLIENNIIYQSGFHGITVSGGENIQVLNNTVVSPPDTETGYTVWIRLSDATNSVVEGNVANSINIVGDSQVTESNNILTRIESSDGVLAYSDVFVNDLARYSDEAGEFTVLGQFNVGADTGVFVYENSAFAGDTTNNTINGTDSSEVIFGFGGDDKLFGFGDSDTIYGGQGEDELSGGNGDDVLIGGSDSDTLTGGEGSDTFKYSETYESGLGSANRDVVTDFDATNGDKLSFEGLASADFEYDFDDNTKVLSVDVDGDSVMDMEIELIGVSIDDLDSSDFLI
ncbi:MAG: VCBS domain-containing protein [Proteobacteria bacterium]|nr:VCBS domain-containing protein [Pseudomonadota bacterium]